MTLEQAWLSFTALVVGFIVLLMLLGRPRTSIISDFLTGVAMAATIIAVVSALYLIIN